MAQDFAKPITSQEELTNSRHKKENAYKGPSTPKILGMLALIAGFVVFIVHLNNLNPEVASQDTPETDTQFTENTSDNTPETVVLVNKSTADEQPAIAEKSTKDLTDPTKEKRRFEFYDTLKNQKVEVSEVEAYMSKEERLRKNNKNYIPPKYFVQAASFKSISDANALRAKLLLDGLTDARIRGGSTYYRVVAGPYTERKDINNARKIMYRFSLQPILLREQTLTDVSR